MPAWANDVARLIFAIAGLAFSLGFIGLVWRVAWAARGFAETEKSRARTNEQLVQLVSDFIRVQQQTNQELSIGLRTLAGRVRKLEEEDMVGS